MSCEKQLPDVNGFGTAKPHVPAVGAPSIFRVGVSINTNAAIDCPILFLIYSEIGAGLFHKKNRAFYLSCLNKQVTQVISLTEKKTF